MSTVSHPKPGRWSFPPRGAPRSPGAPPDTAWLSPAELDDTWTYDGGKGVLLGCDGDRLLGRVDDRHVVVIAGSRAGKTRSLLIPQLLRYEGSAVVIDPKGELFQATADARRGLGHKVVLLNPFNVHGAGTHSHNPIRELMHSPTLTADAAQLADALIIATGNDTHWTDAAKNLIMGVILQMITVAPDSASIPALRTILANGELLGVTLEAMAENDEALDGVISNIGLSMLGKCERGADGARSFSREMQSIISTALEQTRSLDDVRSALDRHDFDLAELSEAAPVTIYLVLPAMRIGTHHRWLRLFIYQAMAALERNPIPRERLPLWMILEEFAALGNVKAIETAAGYMAGMGCKLLCVLQDLNQLRTHYKNSWETFLGNAGVIVAFGNVDATTTKYLSELLGQTTVTEAQVQFVSSSQRAHGDPGIKENQRQVPLLAPSEITLHFARETGRQLVLVPGMRPAFMTRLRLPLL